MSKDKLQLEEIVNKLNLELVRQKAEVCGLGAGLKEARDNFVAVKLDNQLLNRQIGYYKQELDKMQKLLDIK